VSKSRNGKQQVITENITIPYDKTRRGTHLSEEMKTIFSW
jgi:hypothetical protein